MLAVGLLGVAVYFTVVAVWTLQRLLHTRRLAPTALVVWPARRSSYQPLLVGLGMLAAILAVVAAVRGRPLFNVYSQGIMALYFALLVPLAARIPRGLYRDGVWTDTGFLPYARIRRMAFQEKPELVLILLARGGFGGGRRLAVPLEEYGRVRKLLEERIRAGALSVDQGILGLE